MVSSNRATGGQAAYFPRLCKGCLSNGAFRKQVRYKEWLDRVYTPKRRELYGEGTANISGVDLNLKMPVVPSLERRQKLQNANTEASYVTNISEVLGTRSLNVIQNTSIHDTAPDQTRSKGKGFSQDSESCARDDKCAMAQLKVREF